MLTDYATAAEAMALLKVRQQTLYAYVSRGWIRSVAQKGLKEKLYLREDIARVGQRSLARSGHGPVAASAMNWGEPIFVTSITEITEQGPRYCGQLAADLVNTGVAFEHVAELLWTGALPAVETNTAIWPVLPPVRELGGLTKTLAELDAGDNLLEAFAMVVLMLGMRRGPVAQRLQQGNTLAAAREIMQTLVGCCAFIGPAQAFEPLRKGQSLVDGLMQSLAMTPTSDNREALRSVLILMADHELPPGTLSARVVASTGGTLHSCLASALCATSGADVGRMYGRVEDFLGHPKSKSVLRKRVNRLHAAGQRVPGFGHPLYPKGDPRANVLLEMARARSHDSRELRAIFGFLDDLRTSDALLPRQEFAVVVLCRALGLPRQAAAALFALGRTAGWVAHVLEQRSGGSLLRPRAQFVSKPTGN
ncbi:MAG: citrate synthase [Polaromonas sp.]|jgi:citrate synthase|nr:citrate synthase [Polaromonas sp.]MDB5846015.1 citrate synthase [Polaromonas sp.]